MSISSLLSPTSTIGKDYLDLYVNKVNAKTVVADNINITSPTNAFARYSVTSTNINNSSNTSIFFTNEDFNNQPTLITASLPGTIVNVSTGYYIVNVFALFPFNANGIRSLSLLEFGSGDVLATQTGTTSSSIRPGLTLTALVQGSKSLFVQVFQTSGAVMALDVKITILQVS